MRRLLAALALALLPSLAFGAARTASADGLWSSTGTWGGSAVPTLADACTISDGIEVLCDAAPCQCGSLVITAPSAGLVMKAGARSLKLGNTTGAAGDGNLTVGGYLNGGPSHTLEFNLDRTTELAMGVVAITGRMNWEGRTIYSNGTLTGVAAISGSITIASGLVTVSRTVTVTDSANVQPSVDFYNGKFLVPTSGFFADVAFPITTGGATNTEMVLEMDSRGSIDSRNKAGRQDPTAWVPGDWGAIISRADASSDDATVENGSQIVTFDSGIFADVNAATAQLLGSRFVCAADVSADDDADIRRVCYVNSATSATLCSAYGTTSCNAAAVAGGGGGFRVYIDNQPPRAVKVDEILRPGDTYRIMEPARIRVTSGRESNSSPDGHYNVVISSGSTTTLRDILIDDCGFDRGADADDEDLSCLEVTGIDNSLTTEQFTLARADFFRPQGEGVVSLIDSKNITIEDINMHDCNEGGLNDSHECHGLLISKGSVLPTGIVLRSSRIKGMNDAPIGITGAGTSEQSCDGCRFEGNTIGFWPANLGGSVALTSTSPVIDTLFLNNRIINGWGVAFTPSLAGSVLNHAAGSGNIYINCMDPTGAFRGGSYSSTTDNTDALNKVAWTGNAVIGSNGPCFLRGYNRGNFCAPLNPLSSLGGITPGAFREAQRASGNIVVAGPYTATSVADGFYTQPTSAALAALHPTQTILEDNVVIANTSQTLNASCAASLSPWPCCTGSGTGNCNSITHYAFQIDVNGTGAESLDYVLRHNSMFCNDKYATGQSIYGVNVEPSNAAAELNDNIMLDCERSFREGAGGTGDTTCASNLTLAAFAAAEFSGGAASCAVGSGGNLNTGNLSWPRTDIGDLSSFDGSTPWTSLGSDGAVRGARVAGPPNLPQLKALWPYAIYYDTVGRAPGDASYAAGLALMEIATTNSIGDVDTDLDGAWNTHDNCTRNWNPDQYDGDADGIGCACDTSGDTCP